jgi:hypothetical protein
MKKTLVVGLLAAVMTLSIAAPFLREIPGDEVDDEPDPVYVSMAAGRIYENDDAIFKMVRSAAAWTERGDPMAKGYVLTELKKPKDVNVHSVLRSMTYYCKPFTALQTSMIVYDKERKETANTPAMAIPLDIAPGTPAEIETNFMCEGLETKPCTAKDCV